MGGIVLAKHKEVFAKCLPSSLRSEKD